MTHATYLFWVARWKRCVLYVRVCVYNKHCNYDRVVIDACSERFSSGEITCALRALRGIRGQRRGSIMMQRGILEPI
jgi:hypothetical protein